MSAICKKKYRSLLSRSVAIMLCGLLAGCSTWDNPLEDLEAPSLPSIGNPAKWFEGPEKKLPGERIAVIQQEDQVRSEPTAATAPVIVPPASLNSVWSQPGGVPSNAPGHLSLNGSLKVRWSADIGRGSSSKGKLTASPIVVGGRVFTLDTRGRVSAFAAGTGSKVWSGSLTPQSEKDHEGFGGGLAFDGGRLFVATGYGTVTALDPSNGSVLWTEKVGAPIRNSPTAAAGKIFVVTTEGRLFCLAGVDGQQLWDYRGLPESAALLSNASPAVSGNIVVVPFASGDVLAFNQETGEPVWSESLARRRAGQSLAALTNPSRPAVQNGTAYVVGNGGRMVATAVETGERLWDKNIRGLQAPWVAGDTVFVVDINGRLNALDRKTGLTRWAVSLDSKVSWTGPVLASGRLWLMSSKGELVGVDAANGRVSVKKDVSSKVFIAPIVANGQMYVLNDSGRLIAIN